MKRILFLGDFAYVSGKAVASGVIRYVAAHPGLDLRLHGRTSEMPLMRRGLVPDSAIDGVVAVGRIPERCGYDVPNHFMQLFKARTGMTMLQWRRAR